MAITKIGTPELFDFSATNTALQLPTGDTASRPSAPSAGEWRFNSELKYVEYYDGAAWFRIDTESSSVFTPSENFNVNTYTGNGGTQTLDAKFNEAANFNGSSSLITLPSGLNPNNNFSWSFWVNFNSLTNYDTPIALQDTHRNYLDILANGTLHFYDGVSLNSPTGTVTTSTWYNVVITKSSSTGRKMYVNGSEVASDSSTTNSIGGSGQNMIGAYNSGSSTALYLDGKIDQVRFFNTALTAAQAIDCYTDETTTTAATLNFPAGAGCIAAYQLDGNGNDVGLTTTTTTATYQLDNATTSIPNNTYPGTAYNLNAYVTGKFGDAASFNGSSSYITANTLPAIGTGDFGFSCWFNQNSGTSQGALFSTTTQWFAANGSVSPKVLMVTDDTVTKKGDTAYAQGVWNHAVFTRASGVLKIYQNGSEVFSGSYTDSWDMTQFGIGVARAFGSRVYYFNGGIDQVRIFDIALPQAAVTALYNETTTTATSPSISYSTYPGTTTDIGYTGLKFTPDLTWIKILDLPYDNNLYDTVRGADGGSGAADKVLTSNKTTAQEQGLGDVTIQTNAVKVVETVGSPSSSEVNKNGDDFVSWNFKAGGAPTATNSAGAGNVPTSGSVMIDGVASTTALTGTAAVKKISANTAAGFSIVTFSNNNSTTNTFDHKLGGQPELVFIKGTDFSNDWFTYVDSLGKDKRLKLNSSDNVSNWNTNDGTNTPTGINDTTLSFAYSGTTYNFIAYLFRSIDKYQKIGSYTGTALSNNFVQTDFTPSFVLIKSSTLTSTNWVIIDSKRSSGTLWLYPNTSDDEEGPYTNTALNSNGFTVDGNSSYVNGSGETYIYLAIAQ